MAQITDSDAHSGFKFATMIDLIKYYNDNGITDYPKKKDGTPNMGRTINKDNLSHVQTLMNKPKKMKGVNSEIQTDTCPICDSAFEDVCILKCKHKFCVTCAISHFRVKHNCPLCREVICTIPKTTVPICDDYIEAITENVFNNQHQRRSHLSMSGYILEKLTYYKRNNVIKIEQYVTEIQSELYNCMFDISDSITDWYTA